MFIIQIPRTSFRNVFYHSFIYLANNNIQAWPCARHSFRDWVCAITLPAKIYLVKAVLSPVVMNGCESWTIKKASVEELIFWTVVLEKTLESPLDCKEIKSVNPKWNQSWIFIGRIDAEAETPILWPLDAKNWLIGKDPDGGQDLKQEEKERT